MLSQGHYRAISGQKIYRWYMTLKLVFWLIKWFTISRRRRPVERLEVTKLHFSSSILSFWRRRKKLSMYRADRFVPVGKSFRIWRITSEINFETEMDLAQLFFQKQQQLPPHTEDLCGIKCVSRVAFFLSQVYFSSQVEREWKSENAWWELGGCKFFRPGTSSVIYYPI